MQKAPISGIPDEDNTPSLDGKDGRLRIAVLASGSGSNLQALLDFATQPFAKYQIVVVGVNRDDAKAIERAEHQGIPTFVEPHRRHDSRQSFERALVENLRRFRPDWIVLAGFMRVLSETFVSAFPKRIVNVHPALCPAFPGLHAARQALEAGVRVTGCTVHLVDDGVDTGPILAQAAVPVRADDDEQALQLRIQQQEHRLLPAVMQAIAVGHLRQSADRFHLTGLEPDSEGLGWSLRASAR